MKGARAESIKTQYVCQACGYATPRWLGQCPDCGQWNRMQEEPVSRVPRRDSLPIPQPLRLSEVELTAALRQPTTMPELDRVLGGGVVPGSLVLVGGDPGIGKSTLLLQMASRLGATQSVLYISGEESYAQIKLRAERLNLSPAHMEILCETRVDAIEKVVETRRPAVVVVDSIQTLQHPEIASVPGSVTQVRESGQALMRLAKGPQGPAIFMVGHVTKEGQLAGPRIVEHMVDTVLYFEGDRQQGFRILRAAKNRFGPTDEVGLFEMESWGLNDVLDPSRLFLSPQRGDRQGSAVAVSLEGTRPLLVEVQALVAPSYFGIPQRRVSGLDYNRCCLMLAVLEKRANVHLGSQDVFVSVAGGLTLREPALDLAVAIAMVSSHKDKAADAQTAWLGEIGLGGEIRPVPQCERRLQAAAQLGFKRCVMPQRNLEQLKRSAPLETLGVDTLAAAVQVLG